VVQGGGKRRKKKKVARRSNALAAGRRWERKKIRPAEEQNTREAGLDVRGAQGEKKGSSGRPSSGPAREKRGEEGFQSVFFSFVLQGGCQDEATLSRKKDKKRKKVAVVPQAEGKVASPSFLAASLREGAMLSSADREGEEKGNRELPSRFNRLTEKERENGAHQERGRGKKKRILAPYGKKKGPCLTGLTGGRSTMLLLSVCYGGEKEKRGEGEDDRHSGRRLLCVGG